MNPATGWKIRRDPDAVSDPYVASNLDTGETVFGRDLADLAGQVPPFTIARHIATARREMGEEVWAELNRDWL